MRVPHYRIYETLKQGSRGEQVVALQRELPLWASNGVSLVADGIFGEKTTEAVKAFQTAMNLTSDGIVGASTATALRLWAYTELGFDASHYNLITWEDIDTSVYKFTILKATEGATYTDPSFTSHATRALSVGLSLGAYHYTKFRNTPKLEVDNFAKSTEEFNNDIDVFFLDLEERTTNLSSKEIYKWVMTFLEEASVRFGKKRVGIYTSSNYLREKSLQGYESFAQYRLWAASWSSQPLVSPWSTWDTWQYTNKGSVSWCQGPLDFNRRIVT